MRSREYQPIFLSDHPNQIQDDDLSGDLHVHTELSDGLVRAEKIIDMALGIGLNALAITDHNSIEGADIAANYVAKNNLPIELIRGIEVSSADGHILALDVANPISQNLSLVETIREVHKQKGLVIVPHIHPRRINCVTFDKIQEVLDSEDPDLYLDGIEVYNATEERLSRLDSSKRLFRTASSELIKFIEKNKNNKRLGAFLANSDTHTNNVGYGLTTYKEDSILDAIKKREVFPYKIKASYAEDLSQAGLMAYAIIFSHLFGNMSIFKNE